MTTQSYSQIAKKKSENGKSLKSDENGNGNDNENGNNQIQHDDSNHIQIESTNLGFIFLQQYYKYLIEEPQKLHLFYNQDSNFVHGNESEQIDKVYGRNVSFED